MNNPRLCRVRGCGTSETRMFSFPKDPTDLEKWRRNLKIPATTHLPPTNSYVCAKHFEAYVVGGKCLKKGAIPTLYLGHDDDPQYSCTIPKKQRSCCVEGCFSEKGHTLYAFPRSGEARKSWALACNVQPAITDRLYVCKRHFLPEQVSRFKVLDGAVPCLKLEPVSRSRSPSTGSDWVCPPVIKTYVNRTLGTEEDLTLEDFEKYSKLEEKRQASQKKEICEGLDTTISGERFAQAARFYRANEIKLNNRIKELEIENEKLQQKYKNLCSRAVVAEVSSSSDAITFAKMIVSGQKNRYTEEEKALAQNINYMSSKAYTFMRDDLGFALPHKSSLLRWRPIKYVVPGFDANVVYNLKNIVSSMSDTERICVLLFDEIIIKSDLSYNKSKDLIDGYVDHGEGQRENKLGNRCLFFMIKGICSKWKYVFSYYISSGGIPTKTLWSIVQKNIAQLKEMGLNLKGIVCDQGASNTSMFNTLGISEKRPFFMQGNTKIFCMYDYCHLIKSVRNTLMKYDILTPNGVASFKVIKKLFDIDQMNPHFKICPKLTEAHIYPSFLEKMSVSRATQVLSNSVASGIDMALSQNLLGNDAYVVKCAKPTQIFVKKMNDLFDELDAKNFQSKTPFKCPIRRGDTRKIERLNEYVDFLRSIQLPVKVHVKCIEGFRITISAMKMLSEELFEKYESLTFILTGKINQDALENFFYRIRASQGMNTHPTAHDVQYIVARLISMNILRQRFQEKGANCEDDDDINLDWNVGPEDRHLHTEVGDQQSEDLVLEEIDVEDESFSEETDNAEVQVQRYYTGYGIYQKVLCKLKCEKCSHAMLKTKGELKLYSEALIRSKNFTDDSDLRLVNPEDRVFEVCRLQMVWYRQLFAKYAHIAGLRSFLLSAIKNKTEERFPDWFVGSGECQDHRVQLLDFLLTVLLFKNAKWLLRNEQNNIRLKKVKNKLKKL